MKKIEAIIRKEKFEEVKVALHEADIDFLSFWDVKGQGTEKLERYFRGAAYDVSSIERVNLSFVVRDINLEKSIAVIRKHAYTGESGDGRIFVIPIEQSIRIRTGEIGDDALYDKK
jgi:nitrogen regulatory protein P-II 1